MNDLFPELIADAAVGGRDAVARKFPAANKFHVGNGGDGKHYWLTPPDLYARLDAEFSFDFDPCPFPKPDDFDGLTCEWGLRNYVNPPFGSIIHQGKKRGPTAWIRKSLLEVSKGKLVVLVYPIDKWIFMAVPEIRNLGDVRWLATEDRSAGKGTGRHIACFVMRPTAAQLSGRLPQYRIVEADGGCEPQMLYSTGDGKAVWFPLNAQGFWLEPDAFSKGNVTDHNFFSRAVAIAAIERAKAINNDCRIISPVAPATATTAEKADLAPAQASVTIRGHKAPSIIPTTPTDKGKQ